jgi:hypothetical protein
VIYMLQESSVTYLVGDKKISTRPLVPYNALLCEFLNSLSSELRTCMEAAAYPDIMTFAFWCRKANITKYRADFEDGRNRLGLGLVFHITPSNVPVSFAYSFAFGLLSGNANIVRIPSKPFPQTDIICSAINRMLDNDKYSEVKAMTAFVKYEQDDEINGMFSANCNARIIWGGDMAIRNIRKFPIQERCVDIAFADRYSFCIIDSQSVLELDDAGLEQLAEGFYNDTYLMDQNACSSPHLIVWQGERIEIAKEKFWSAIYSTVSEKYNLVEVNAVDKYALLCKDAIELDNVGSFNNHHNFTYRVGINELPDNTDELRGKCGYFYEYDASDISSIAHIINPKYQTLTYFGVDSSLLLDFVVENRLTGIDRIVPVGRSLDIEVIWDGFDIVKSLSRIIDVK